MLNHLTPEMDFKELIPGYVFDIVENDWKEPFVNELLSKIINE